MLVLVHKHVDIDRRVNEVMHGTASNEAELEKLNTLMESAREDVLFVKQVYPEMMRCLDGLLHLFDKFKAHEKVGVVARAEGLVERLEALDERVQALEGAARGTLTS
jgi:hypothetical protein